MKRFAQLGLAAVLALGPFTGSAFAQQAQSAAPAVQAQAKDVESIDGIVAALYDVISGPAGKERDWNRMRSLFVADGTLRAVVPKDGAFVIRTMTVDDYITRNSPHFASNGFFESEVARTTEVFGQVAQVFSTYQSKHASSDAQPFARGINSIQLYNDGKRWHIVSVLWRGEDANLKLPERYLKKQ